MAMTETERVARDVDSLSLPLLYARTAEAVNAATTAWLRTVADEHPGFTNTMRGHNPPMFLNERARIDAVVMRVKAKLNTTVGKHVS